MKQNAHTDFEQRLMQDLCRYIERHSEENLTLARLAKQAHLSPAHLQRRFKRIIGVSPKEYADSCRLKKLKAGLRGASSVTGAIYDAGFSSASRVYEGSNNKLGMTPKQYKNTGQYTAISYALSKTAFGSMLMAATDRGLCFVEFADDEKTLILELNREFPNAAIAPMQRDASGQFSAWMKALNDYLKGATAMLDLPLDIRGTAFQRKVWSYLQTIPAGQTRSYSEVAQGIGSPKAVRAVASACANNNVSIVIPCHRVIRGSGGLAGYRWGLARKRALLAFEEGRAPDYAASPETPAHGSVKVKIVPPSLPGAK